MSSFNVEIADARFFRRVFAILAFAAITSLSGTVLALLMEGSLSSLRGGARSFEELNSRRVALRAPAG
jgi:hypothetical protein